MRLWSLHPRYLDSAGLVACWREALLAQKVLRGLTAGYRSHPQLTRFREQADPVVAIATYLHHIADEADHRGYRFDRSRVVAERDDLVRLTVADGQVSFEWRHLLEKLSVRDPERAERLSRPGDASNESVPEVHPMFAIIRGGVAEWERAVPLG